MIDASPVQMWRPRAEDHYRAASGEDSAARTQRLCARAKPIQSAQDKRANKNRMSHFRVYVRDRATALAGKRTRGSVSVRTLHKPACPRGARARELSQVQQPAYPNTIILSPATGRRK